MSYRYSYSFNFILKIAALLLIAVFAFNNNTYAQSSPLKIVYFDDYAPYSEFRNGQMRGILVDVLTEALQTRMGIKVVHEGYPWARAQLLVKLGQADAYATVPTPERSTYVVFSKEPVAPSMVVLFVKAGSPKINELKKIKTVADLKPFKLGQYLGHGWAEKNLQGMDIVWTTNVAMCWEMLLSDRFDAFVDTLQVMHYNLKKAGLADRIIALPNVIDSTTFNLGIGKKSAYSKILTKFDTTIKAMRKDGTLQRITDKYK